MNKAITFLSMVSKLGEWYDGIKEYLYYSVLLGTPKDFKWSYKHDGNELVSVSLRYGVEEMARIKLAERTVIISSDYSSAAFRYEEGMPLFRIQKSIFRWIENDGNCCKVGIKGMMLLHYSRYSEIREEAKALTYEYQWLTRDNHSWLLKGNDEVICHIYNGPETTVYKYKEQPAIEIEHYDAEEFRNYIENLEKHGYGSKRA